MISSMTGYGEAEGKTQSFTANFQISSVNNKYLDIKMNFPRLLNNYENDFVRIIKKYVRRGKLDINLNLNLTKKKFSVHIDDALIDALLKESNRVQKKYKLINDLNMSTLINIKGIMTYSEKDVFDKKDLADLKTIFESALKKYIKMKKIEGLNLHKDLETQQKTIRSNLEKIRTKILKLEDSYKKRLIDKTHIFKEDLQIDNNRLLAEVAILLSKSDINEELIRLESHINQFLATMKEHGPAGKKLDFIAQEELREANTIASKINDEKIIRIIINIKDALEKIREQVQNIE